MSQSGQTSTDPAQANVLYQLAENADKLDNIQEMTLILQQQFVRLFRTEDVPSRQFRLTAASLASMEEEKLLAVRAVQKLHTVGLQRHGAFFQSESYHTSAAFFIHRLLGSLCGDKQSWFQQLQVESLRACTAVVRAVGCGNARLCLPGIVSTCVRYISRATRGTDPLVVRTTAIELLHASLTTSLLTQGDEAEWLQNTVTNLGHSMARLLASNVLTCEGMTLPFAQALLRLTRDVLRLPFLSMFCATPLMRELLVGHFVLSNLAFLLAEDVSEFDSQIPSTLLQELGVVDVLLAQLGQLRGVELLHFVSALLRCRTTRAEVFREESRYVSVLCRVFQQCIHVVGTEMNVEDLYCTRSSREKVRCVVDEFIQCAAHALFAIRGRGGAQTLEMFMNECEKTLMDWDLYMLHPATIYVVIRLVVWQFKTPFWATEEKDEVGANGKSAEALVLSGNFEQLWGIVAQSHLWNITEDEQLCSYQQLRHRQTVAATILNSVELAACVLRDEPVTNKAKRKRAVQRLNVLVLYLVLEKATGSTIVHDTAMRAMEALGEAGRYPDTLDFFMDQSGFVVDEAARAVTEESFRASAASVLRGGVSFIQKRLFSSFCRRISNAVTLRQWVDAFTDCRLAVTMGDLAAVSKVSDFVASAIKVACDGCRRATLQEDKTGALASVELLADCFSVSATLNRSVPQLGVNEEQECLTTAAEPRVQILQLVVLEAMQMLLAYCTRNDAVAPSAIRVVTRGLTVFLTTPKAETWSLGAQGDDNQPPPVFPWDESVTAVLSRSHLRTVYKIYLSFMAILSEPIAAFATTNASRRRSAQERRALEDVRITPAVLVAMEGLEALFVLATEFLSRRVVEEVLPVVVTWHERGGLPRISTKTEERLQTATERFLRNACAIDPLLSNEVSAACTALLPSFLPLSLSPTTAVNTETTA